MEMCHFYLRQCHCSGGSKVQVLGQESCLRRTPTGIGGCFKGKCRIAMSEKYANCLENEMRKSLRTM